MTELETITKIVKSKGCFSFLCQDCYYFSDKDNSCDLIREEEITGRIEKKDIREDQYDMYLYIFQKANTKLKGIKLNKIVAMS
jgi:hypothetical protein